MLFFKKKKKGFQKQEEYIEGEYPRCWRAMTLSPTHYTAGCRCPQCGFVLYGPNYAFNGRKSNLYNPRCDTKLRWDKDEYDEIPDYINSKIKQVGSSKVYEIILNE